MTVVALAPGRGTVARRDHALLFVPGEPSPVLRPFLDAPDAAAARAAVTSALMDAGFEAEPFTLVTWDDGFQLLVFGALEVRTDMAELPMLSGAGSATWVERRVAPLPDTVKVYAGSEATEGTDLTGGVVVAGGFDATITPDPVAAPTTTAAPADNAEPREAAGTEPIATQPDETATAPGEAVADPGTDVVPEVGYTPPSEDVVASRADGLAALQAATGGDWMEDSLGLGGTPNDPPAEPGEPGEPTDTTASSDTAAGDELDDEVTLGRDDVLPPGPIAPSPGTDTSGDGPADTAPASQPPVTSGGSPLPPPTGDPHQVGFEPREGGVDERAIVTARECPTGHLNAPHASRCRICALSIHPEARTVTVRQPVLGLVVLPDGTSHTIDSTMVLGRKPDTDAAKVDAGARTIRIETSSAVSRTHLVIRPEGWTITVTDCGSRGGSVVISEPNTEPTILQPWVPQETPIGSEVYLGGPTKIVIAKPGGPPPSGGAIDTLELPELPD